MRVPGNTAYGRALLLCCGAACRFEFCFVFALFATSLLLLFIPSLLSGPFSPFVFLVMSSVEGGRRKGRCCSPPGIYVGVPLFLRLPLLPFLVFLRGTAWRFRRTLFPSAIMLRSQAARKPSDMAKASPRAIDFIVMDAGAEALAPEALASEEMLGIPNRLDMLRRSC